MKVNALYSIIAVAIAALIAYGIYSFCRSENELLMAIGSFLFIGFPLFLAMGVSSPAKRSSANMKVLAVVFFLLMLALNILFACLSHFSTPLYIITNGIAVLVFFIIYHSIYSTKQ
ncbi:MAG: hypothetical protein IJL57_00175 [Bacteroidales bacterium]|nr:hypothetical protein [Bacteroidales bacterium]